MTTFREKIDRGNEQALRLGREANKERRHREKMAVKRKESELTRQLLQLKEQKVPSDGRRAKLASETTRRIIRVSYI